MKLALAVSAVGRRASLLRPNQPLKIKGRSSSSRSFWEQNNFENFAKTYEDFSKDAAKSTPFWRNMTLFVCCPLVASYAVYCYFLEQKEHHKPRPEFVPYEHLRIRTSEFPWGDGNHSLFHNPVRNPLPDGYEVPDPAAEHH